MMPEAMEEGGHLIYYYRDALSQFFSFFLVIPVYSIRDDIWH